MTNLLRLMVNRMGHFDDLLQAITARLAEPRASGNSRGVIVEGEAHFAFAAFCGFRISCQRASRLTSGSRRGAFLGANVLIPVAVGVLLGALFVAVAQRLRVERSWYSIGLVTTALIYVGFALASRDHVRLRLELCAAVLYSGVALLGAWCWPWLVSVGWAGHTAWDIILHSGVRDTPVAPWYPPACLGFDLVVALSYARRLISRCDTMSGKQLKTTESVLKLLHFTVAGVRTRARALHRSCRLLWLSLDSFGGRYERSS